MLVYTPKHCTPSSKQVGIPLYCNWIVYLITFHFLEFYVLIYSSTVMFTETITGQYPIIHPVLVNFAGSRHYVASYTVKYECHTKFSQESYKI